MRSGERDRDGAMGNRTEGCRWGDFGTFAFHHLDQHPSLTPPETPFFFLLAILASLVSFARCSCVRLAESSLTSALAPRSNRGSFFTSVLPLATIASAIVLPDLSDVQTWENIVPSKESIGKVASAFKDDLDAFTSGVEDILSHAGDAVQSTLDNLLGSEDADADVLGHHHHHHKTSNLTIYQLIKASDHTKKFAALVDEHDSVVQLLNSTKANYTLFVPVDAAFERIPDHGKKPSRDFVDALLRYHIGVGLYPAPRLLVTHTLPTALDEAWLDDEPQRLRTRVGLFGVTVNFYNKVIKADIRAKNGVIHAVKHILVPPPMVGRVLSLVPSKFSTLLLAYEKTDFVSFIHHVKMRGSTVFAPSNQAFARLGPSANAFLFNSEHGLKYLRALLKYQIVANETLYSDAFYRAKAADAEHVVTVGRDENGVEADGLRHYHVDMPSLLDEKNIAVDITRWGGLIDVKVNGYVHVGVQDGVARNGVIQVVDRVLFPHRTPGAGRQGEVNAEEEELLWGGEVDVEDIKARLGPLVEEDDEDFSFELGGRRKASKEGFEFPVYKDDVRRTYIKFIWDGRLGHSVVVFMETKKHQMTVWRLRRPTHFMPEADQIHFPSFPPPPPPPLAVCSLPSLGRIQEDPGSLFHQS
ncbi:FAS1 domain-containing protein [Sodiomyces alkalinus F11]|uniref:FAS1 domain-containing protein n=1 Tax=Sodiomyces alkalinus (strain CBS 110278 / VKM F-3762 / F11) TaxID=1314773 RepID=A0A3N2PKP0_SODAK|nr:FAS1 domain-containing protein [Sodiomyces alkalinus F11]ROT35069.1 FAS1 domain-containing protein [Sodiomyces alkalinus F11]